MEGIKVERTGRACGMASSEFRVTYPDGHVGTIWSPPWHEMSEKDEEAGALEAAAKFWADGTHKDRGGSVTVG